MASEPEVGQPAPDFVLPGIQDEVALSCLAAQGKVVLAFYAEDNTPACTSELAAFRGDCDAIQALGADEEVFRALGLEPP